MTKKPIALTILLFGLYILCFSLLEQSVPKSVFLIDTWADHMIPFSKYAVVLYCTWHLEIAAILLSYLYCRNIGGYWRVLGKLLLGMFLILVICAVFPNMVALRPGSVEGRDFFANMTRLVYRQDNNLNVFPSGHAFGAVIMAKAWSGIADKSWQKAVSWILNAGIILSTFFLKQHSVIDAAGGILLAIIIEMTAEWIINWVNALKMPRKADSFAGIGQ